MNNQLLSKIKDNTDILEDTGDENLKLTKKLIRRVDYLNHQMELQNNILISMARASNRDDLNNRLDALISME